MHRRILQVEVIIMQDVRQSTVTKIELKKAVLLSEQIAQLKEQTEQVFGEHGQLLHIFMQKTHA